MLSRERVTVFTQVSSDPKIELTPEVIFKGKGTGSCALAKIQYVHEGKNCKMERRPKGHFTSKGPNFRNV